MLKNAVPMLTLVGLATALACRSADDDLPATHGTTPATVTPTCILVDPYDPSSPCGPPEEVAELCAPQPQCGPPTPAYDCIYVVIESEAECLPRGDPRVGSGTRCEPIELLGRAFCLPIGTTNSTVLAEGGEPDYGAWFERGDSLVRVGKAGVDFRVAPIDEEDFRGMRAALLPGSTPAPLPYDCRWAVINEVVCLPLNDDLVRGCRPVSFANQSGCLPVGAKMTSVFETGQDPTTGTLWDKDFIVITRGNSNIKYNTGDDLPVVYMVAPEDEADFAALHQVFRPQ